MRRRGTKFYPGLTVGTGTADTLFAKSDGYVTFEGARGSKKQISVYTEKVN